MLILVLHELQNGLLMVNFVVHHGSNLQDFVAILCCLQCCNSDALINTHVNGGAKPVIPLWKPMLPCIHMYFAGLESETADSMLFGAVLFQMLIKFYILHD